VSAVMGRRGAPGPGGRGFLTGHQAMPSEEGRDVSTTLGGCRGRIGGPLREHWLSHRQQQMGVTDGKQEVGVGVGSLGPGGLGRTCVV
jgi:hypothetical protein